MPVHTHFTETMNEEELVPGKEAHGFLMKALSQRAMDSGVLCLVFLPVVKVLSPTQNPL
jgi:hypothetical protein